MFLTMITCLKLLSSAIGVDNSTTGFSFFQDWVQLCVRVSRHTPNSLVDCERNNDLYILSSTVLTTLLSDEVIYRVARKSSHNIIFYFTLLTRTPTVWKSRGEWRDFWTTLYMWRFKWPVGKKFCRGQILVKWTTLNLIYLILCLSYSVTDFFIHPVQSLILFKKH